MTTNKPHSCAGFTLVELMVTVAIIAIAAGFTFAELNSSSYKLKSASRTLKANMQKARLLAVKNSCPVYVDFDFNRDGNIDSSYTIWKDLNWNDPDPTNTKRGIYNDATTDNNGDSAVDALDEELIETISLPGKIAFGTVANADGGPAQTPNGGTLPADGVWFTNNVDRLRFSPWGTSSNGNAYLHYPNQDSAGSHTAGTNNIGRIRSLYYATNGGSWR